MDRYGAMQLKPNDPEQATFRDVLAAAALHACIVSSGSAPYDPWWPYHIADHILHHRDCSHATYNNGPCEADGEYSPIPPAGMGGLYS